MSDLESYDFPEIELTSDALPRVPLDNVLELQTLAMSKVMPLARTLKRLATQPRTTGFTLLHETNPGVTLAQDLILMPDASGMYDRKTDVDTYLTVLVKKPTPRNWRLTISFLQYALRDDERLTNARDLYSFEWRRGDNEALGTRRVIRSVGMLSTALRTDTATSVSFEHTERRVRTIDRHIVTTRDCHDLKSKIEEHTDLFLGIAGREAA